MIGYRIAIVLLTGVCAIAQTPPGLKEFSIQPVDSEGEVSNRLVPSGITADRVVLKNLVAFTHHTAPFLVFGPGWLENRYQVSAKPADGAEAGFLPAVAKALEGRLHFHVEPASKEMPVYVLKVAQADAPGLHQSQGEAADNVTSGTLTMKNSSIAHFGHTLARVLGRPVFDETGLAGRYTFDLRWDPDDLTSLTRAVKTQLGFTLAGERRKVDVLTVSRVRN